MPRDNNVDPEVIGPLRRDFDGDRYPTAWTQHAIEACEAPRRVRKKHKAEAAKHGVEARVGKGKGLSVLDRDGRVRQPSQALPSLVRHLRGDVRGQHRAGGTDDVKGRLGRDAGPRRHIKHKVAGSEPQSAKQEGQKMSQT